MSRILAYTSPARGHLFPATAILAQLQSRGHDVRLRTLSTEVNLLRAHGFEARALSAEVEAVEMRDWMHRSPQKALAASVSAFVNRAPFDAADLTAAIEQERPDVLLIDVNAWGASAVAEKSGLPWAVFCPYPLPVPSKDVPPFGPGFAPAAGRPGRLRDALLRPLITGTLQRQMLPGLNGVRDKLGLPPLGALADQFGVAPLLLYLSAEPFEYPRSDWAPNVVLVGPCEWEPPGAGGLPELSGQPLVVVTTSSEFQDDGILVQAALDGLAEDAVQVVATVPSGDASAFRVPTNATVHRFVPHSVLFEHAAAVVTHGGMGATQKALGRGVPVCAVPFGRDQSEVARRVEVAGAGVRLPRRRLSRLRDAVRRTIEMKPGAQRVAAGYRRAGGARAAADSIEGLLVAVSGGRG